MAIKIINSILILLEIFMGIKQGFAMLTGKAEMLDMFGKWGFNKTTVMAFGIYGITSAILIAFPKTFIWGNFMMAAFILMIICFQLAQKDIKGMLIEMPFLLLNLIIIYLQHPLKSS